MPQQAKLRSSVDISERPTRTVFIFIMQMMCIGSKYTKNNDMFDFESTITIKSSTTSIQLVRTWDCSSLAMQGPLLIRV